jgi:hypothetical protein
MHDKNTYLTSVDKLSPFCFHFSVAHSFTDFSILKFFVTEFIIRGPFEKCVNGQQCAAVTQREAVTVLPSCSGGGNIVVA